MSMVSELSDVFGAAFVALDLDPAYGDVVVSQHPDLAQYQCNGALAAAKQAKRAPRAIAEDIATDVAANPTLADVSVAGPGFINITVTDEALASHADEARRDERTGLVTDTPGRIIVDYGGPNVAKELHVGHLRPAIIGEALKRLLRLIGHEVCGDVHLGDWGLPMGQLIVELRERQPDLPYFDETDSAPYPDEPPVSVAELNELYPIASARAADEPEFAEAARTATVELQEGRPGYLAVWQHFRDVSVAAMRGVYDELGVHFDLWYGESTIAPRLGGMIERLETSQVARPSDGALVVDVALDGDKTDIPPLMLRKSDGGTLYTTWDVATIEDRVESLGATELIYVVDTRQSLHFEQVFRTVRKAGIVPPEVVLEHAGNGTVNGANGKPLKTREGDLPLLRDLIADAVALAVDRMDERDLARDLADEERAEIARLVGLAALKYGDLRNHRASDYVFDLDRFTSFDGKTGPYLLYGAVRMQSIFREAAARGLVEGEIVPPTRDPERDLILAILRLPEVVGRAVAFRAPNHIAEFAYELVSTFNRFYEACHILSEEDAARQASWLGLVGTTRRIVGLLLEVLGIEIPERM
ncbi:MAG: arginine--tRNA ligase [Acidimicrobiia bacterium]